MMAILQMSRSRSSRAENRSLTSSLFILRFLGLRAVLGVKIYSAGFLSKYPSRTAMLKICLRSHLR